MPTLSTPLAFLGGFVQALIGMLLWGVGVGAQDSLLKAILTDVVTAETRSTGFGVFDTGFGFASLFGGAAMGWLYGKSLVGLVIFSLALEFAALPMLVRGWSAGQRAS